jgi:hypothetical protein
MAYTLSDLISRVQQRVRDTGYSTSEITSYLNDTQNDVFNEYPMQFMDGLQTYTVTTNVADITDGDGLPTNFVQAISLSDTSTGRERTIPYIEASQLDEQYPDPFDTTSHPANYPMFWTMYDQTIKLFPTPAGAYTLSLKYHKKPTELEDSADVPEIPSEFAELLVVGAAYRVMQVKDNYDQAGVLQNKYDELLQKFVVKYSQLQTGQVTIMPTNTFPRGGNF